MSALGRRQRRGRQRRRCSSLCAAGQMNQEAKRGTRGFVKSGVARALWTLRPTGTRVMLLSPGPASASVEHVTAHSGPNSRRRAEPGVWATVRSCSPGPRSRAGWSRTYSARATAESGAGRVAVIGAGSFRHRRPSACSSSTAKITAYLSNGGGRWSTHSRSRVTRLRRRDRAHRDLSGCKRRRREVERRTGRHAAPGRAGFAVGLAAPTASATLSQRPGGGRVADCRLKPSLLAWYPVAPGLGTSPRRPAHRSTRRTR